MVDSKNDSKSAVTTTAASGAGCLGIFGVIFALAGLAFTAVATKDFLETVDARGWDKVSASLSSAGIDVSRSEDEPFVIRVAFSYLVAGREYTSEQFALKEQRDDNYEKLALKLRELREQDKLVAYVDPDDPATAVLDPGSLASGFTILFPLVFVLVGGAAIWGAVWIARRAKRSVTGAEAISSKPTGTAGSGTAGVVVGVMFTLAGLGTLYPLAISPLGRAAAARHWVETPCKIIWARIKSHDSDDGTTYSVDIFYSYEVDGREYRSSRYGFFRGSSSGRKSKREVVDRYRRAEAPVCYVDPTLPERAILKRKLGLSGLIALVPAVLLLIGVPVLLSGWRSKRGRRDRRDSERRGGAFTSLRGEGGEVSPASTTFSPGKSRLTGVLVLLGVGLFWNGLVFGLLFPDAWLGEGGLFLKLFSLPFMLVGILIAYGFLYSCLALFNPRPILKLEPGEPQLGVTFRGTWQFKGAPSRLRRLQIILTGRERTSYQRGTDTVTDENIFYAVSLADKLHALEMHRGSFEVTLPHDLMYSLELANSSIRWRIEIRGEVPFWPDLGDEFDIMVRPHPIS